MNPHDILQKLVSTDDITVEESQFLAEQMMDNTLSPTLCGAILTALAIKGPTVNELVGFITTMRGRMTHVNLDETLRLRTIDVCGTGGDQKGTINVSTAVAIIVSSLGIPVAKHGNRAASSKTGSADVLEALHIPIIQSPEDVISSLTHHSFAFLFAQHFHPAMKHLAPIRKELKIRTVFNLLGPFCNPAGVTRQMLGVPSPALARHLAHVALQLNYQHIVIVSGHEELDEVSICGKSDIYDIRGTEMVKQTIHPELFGLPTYQLSEITGGTPDENADAIIQVMDGKKSAHRDIIVLNAGVALYVADHVSSIEEGVSLATSVIDSGKAREQLRSLQTILSS